MDVYGAFQLCAIGVLAAPVAVRHSSTYFNDPGRNTIFVWVLVLLAGLVSLTVEFYRVDSTLCKHDDHGRPIQSIKGFPYDDLATTRCGYLHCSPDPNEGPYSPIRGGSADNIYIIPAPDKLTFNTATLLAAACCIPAILLLVSMWFKVLEFIWKSSSSKDGDSAADVTEAPAEERDPVNAARPSLQREKHSQSLGNAECLERSNYQPADEPLAEEPATEKARPNRVANAIREYGEIVVFGAAVFVILVLGERNLFSPQIRYQQEPIVSHLAATVHAGSHMYIGQHRPMVTNRRHNISDPRFGISASSRSNGGRETTSRWHRSTSHSGAILHDFR